HLLSASCSLTPRPALPLLLSHSPPLAIRPPAATQAIVPSSRGRRSMRSIDWLATGSRLRPTSSPLLWRFAESRSRIWPRFYGRRLSVPWLAAERRPRQSRAREARMYGGGWFSYFSFMWPGAQRAHVLSEAKMVLNPV